MLKQAFTLAVFLLRPQADNKSALPDMLVHVSGNKRVGDDKLIVNTPNLLTNNNLN